MTRTPLAPETTRTRARSVAGRRPATRPTVRYCDTPLRSVRGGSVRAPLAPAPQGRPLVEAAPQPVRLTRRGRVLLVLLAVFLLLTVFSLGRVTSTATPPPQPRATVVMQSGETLWQLAKRVAPGKDPRVTIDRILRDNGIKTADQVRTGQQLVLPN